MNLVFSGLLRFLAVIGFGFMSYEGFDTLISALITTAETEWNNMGSNALSLLDMGGFTDSLGYILAAVSTKAALAVTKKFLPKAS